ncbi:GspE/PulE family protein [Nocardioides nematodiphilus]|uniref:GspE/PulE family protein n=1 Tax=Nocardioides nematodiphilus TaxID=2849669 RepID=UPI001CD9D6E6|nr:GspE/PulE family protein [Nocardioides nematodiphilus]MCA1981265.1 GspE/PulE family protein [Nocardioides nematodiphilus]
MLRRGGLLFPDELDELVRQYGEGDRLRQQVIGHGRITEQQFAQALAEQHGLTFVDLGALTLDPQIVAVVPPALCRRRRVMALARTGDRLTLAMTDPGDILAIDDVASVTGLIVRPAVVTEVAMTQAINRYLRSDSELSQISAALEQSAAPSAKGEETEDPDAPVVRFVSLLIGQAIADRASDIHVEPTGSDLKVRLRIDGVLHEMQSADRSIMDGVISRLKIMSELDIAERRKPQDGRMSVKHEGRTVDLRVATLPTVWGEKVVMRILDHSAESRRLQDLQLSPTNLRRYTEAITRPFGMILATGPTGSGKSTTLYTTLAEIAKPELNAITVEDPVEYRLAGVNQMQVNPRAGLTFDNALRAILRADPDILLVGEIRDRETATITVEASLTGHLVLSTLHTNDAPSAITRLTEIGVEPYLVGTALNAVVAQRLARRLCVRCRERYVPEREVVAAVGLPVPSDGELALYRAVGCSFCSGTGYRGRVALHEVMTVSPEIERLAVLRSAAADLRRTALEQGMVPLREDGFAKVLAGITTLEEVLRVAN